MKLLLTTLALVLMTATQAQLATKVNGTNNYLNITYLTDGASLYGVSNDTILDIDKGTGVLSFNQKLPASPAGYTVKWGRKVGFKVLGGFVLDQTLTDATNKQITRLWSSVGGSWDTIINGMTGLNKYPVKLGNKYAVFNVIPNTTSQQIYLTDLTRAGTTQVTNYSAFSGLSFRSGKGRLFFNAQPLAGANAQQYMLTDNGLTLIDSANINIQTLGVIGDDVFYLSYSGGVVGGTVAYYAVIKKYNAATGTHTTLVPNSPKVATYKDGIVAGGNLIVTCTDSSGYGARNNLININTTTGAITYITNNKPDLVYPIYSFQGSAASSGHAYILAKDSISWINIVTDGSIAGTSTYRAAAGIAFFMRPDEASFRDDAYGAVCGDEIYGAQYATSAYATQLYHLVGSGSVSHQDISTATNGSNTFGFINVGADIFFHAASGVASNGYSTYISDLWKISGCNNQLAINESPESTIHAQLYPNPASDRLSVVLDASITGATLTLLDLTGRVVSAEDIVNGTTINTSGIPSGIYLYHIATTDGQAITSRISIEH